MNRTDLDNLMSYAEINHLEDRPFQEVYHQYMKDLEEDYYESEADTLLATMEAHEQYLDAV